MHQCSTKNIAEAKLMTAISHCESLSQKIIIINSALICVVVWLLIAMEKSPPSCLAIIFLLIHFPSWRKSCSMLANMPRGYKIKYRKEKENTFRRVGWDSFVYAEEWEGTELFNQLISNVLSIKEVYFFKILKSQFVKIWPQLIIVDLKLYFHNFFSRLNFSTKGIRNSFKLRKFLQTNDCVVAFSDRTFILYLYIFLIDCEHFHYAFIFRENILTLYFYCTSLFAARIIARAR